MLITALYIAMISSLREDLPLYQLLLLAPLLFLACGAAACLMVVAAKWLLVGRYRPAEKPLWSAFVWRSELVNALHEHLGGGYLAELLRGTPFVAWYLRLLGARIGPRVYLNTLDLTEFDLVDIGAEAVVDECTLQTHLFEDRVMKMSTIVIGERASLGAGAVVLYGTVIEEGASLATLSLVMKGETLPRGTRWIGSPARAEGASTGG